MEKEERPPESAAPEASGPAERGERVMPAAALPTIDLLVWLLGLLAAKAWEGMGLVPRPVTGKIQKDLSEAQLAIDGFAAVLDVVRPRLEDAPRRELETLLTTLRLNFVEKSSAP
jgi:hypothetical protein